LSIFCSCGTPPKEVPTLSLSTGFRTLTRGRGWEFPAQASRGHVTGSCVTQRKAQGPSRTCNESKEVAHPGTGVGVPRLERAAGACAEASPKVKWLQFRPHFDHQSAVPRRLLHPRRARRPPSAKKWLQFRIDPRRARPKNVPRRALPKNVPKWLQFRIVPRRARPKFPRRARGARALRGTPRPGSALRLRVRSRD